MSKKSIVPEIICCRESVYDQKRDFLLRACYSSLCVAHTKNILDEERNRLYVAEIKLVPKIKSFFTELL